MTTRFKIEGLEELLKRLAPELYREPLRRFWYRAAEEVLNVARVRAPVDTGRMRASLQQHGADSLCEIDPSDVPLWIKIGSNVNRKGFYYPRALDESDRYHYRGGGALGAGVAGCPTRGWFTRSVDAAKTRIDYWLQRLGEEIGVAWQR